MNSDKRYKVLRKPLIFVGNCTKPQEPAENGRLSPYKCPCMRGPLHRFSKSALGWVPFNQKNPRANKNIIGTPPPPPPKTQNTPPLKQGILRTWVFLQKERIFQASIKLAQPFLAPELRTRSLRTQGFFWLKIFNSYRQSWSWIKPSGPCTGTYRPECTKCCNFLWLWLLFSDAGEESAATFPLNLVSLRLFLAMANR